MAFYSTIQEGKLYIENGPTNIVAETNSANSIEIYNKIVKYSVILLKDISSELSELKKQTTSKNIFKHAFLNLC